MTTWDMFKFWLIKDIALPFVIIGSVIAFFALMFAGAALLDCIDALRRRWRDSETSKRRKST